MSYIFVIASFLAFFFTLLLIRKKPKSLYDKILLCWLIYLGSFVALFVLSQQKPFQEMMQFHNFIISLFLLHGPFLYLYTSTLTQGMKKFNRNDLLHFVPFAVFVIYLAIASLFPEYSVGIRLDHVDMQIEQPPFFVFLLIVTVISGPVYFILSIRKVRKYREKYMDNFSTIEQLNVNWLKILLYIFGIIWSALFAIAVIHHVFHIASMSFCINGLFLSLSAFILLAGYFGLIQKDVFTHFNDLHEESEKVNGDSTPSKETDSTIATESEEIEIQVDKIVHHMQQEKPYLNPQLSLPLLSSELNIPVHQLSKIINEKFGCNFFDFINNYRVQEVKEKLSDEKYDNFSLLGIAFDSGFNSKSTFNRIFKKETGKTPSEYKNSLE